jgi:hypothetical protein
MARFVERSGCPSVSFCAPWIIGGVGQPLMTDTVAVLVVEDESLILLDIVDQLHGEASKSRKP